MIEEHSQQAVFSVFILLALAMAAILMLESIFPAPTCPTCHVALASRATVEKDEWYCRKCGETFSDPDEEDDTWYERSLPP